jgi:predicted nucleotidyltransferase
MPIPRIHEVLNPREMGATRRFVSRILDEIPVPLIQAALFGSRARGQGRPDSDIDVLLIFHDLPPDREPFATDAERVAEEVAAETGVPVTVWSVSLPDLAEGVRTPMLVDALEDAVPIWCRAEPLPPVPFMPADALRCTEALLERISEGSEEFEQLLDDHRLEAAARRGRDDIVRLCTAALLLRGVTRPRRAAAVRHFLEEYPGSVNGGVPVLKWAAESFGEEGRLDDLPLAPSPGGPGRLARTVDELRDLVVNTAWALAARTSL